MFGFAVFPLMISAEPYRVAQLNVNGLLPAALLDPEASSWMLRTVVVCVLPPAMTMVGGAAVGGGVEPTVTVIDLLAVTPFSPVAIHMYDVVVCGYTE